MDDPAEGPDEVVQMMFEATSALFVSETEAPAVAEV